MWRYTGFIGIFLFVVLSPPNLIAVSVQETLTDLIRTSYMEETGNPTFPLKFKGHVIPTYEEFERAQKEEIALRALRNKLQEKKTTPLTEEQAIVRIVTGYLSLATFAHGTALGALKRMFEDGMFGFKKDPHIVKAFDRLCERSQWKTVSHIITAKHDMKKFNELYYEHRGQFEKPKTDTPRAATVAWDDSVVDVSDIVLDDRSAEKELLLRQRNSSRSG